MRRDIEFDAEGVTLRGWLYTPDSGGGPFATVVMAHGFSAVKEMYLDRFAEHFAGAGLAAVVFDHRNFGASDGRPRQEIDPIAQVRDYRHAITWAGMQDEVDENRIGIWGSSYSGGHVIVVAAQDRRVRCVVGQVPMVSGYRNLRTLVRSDYVAGLRAALDEDRRNRFNGGEPGMLPVVDPDPTAPSALPTSDSWKWFSETGAERAPAWRNEVTLRSVEAFLDYEPWAYLPNIAPTPYRMIVAAGDVLVPSELALEYFELAREPKSCVVLPGGHFDAYTVGFEGASRAASEWFVAHLL